MLTEHTEEENLGRSHVALQLAERGDVVGALAMLGGLIARPDCSDDLRASALNDMGCLYFSTEEWAAAFEALLSSLEIIPDAEETQANMVDLVTAPDFQAALEACDAEITQALGRPAVTAGRVATIETGSLNVVVDEERISEFIRQAESQGRLVVQIGRLSDSTVAGAHDVRHALSPLAQIALLARAGVHAAVAHRTVSATLFDVESFALDTPTVSKNLAPSTEATAAPSSINIEPKDHILFWSLESKSRSWLECYGGRYPSPNFSRLAGMSQVFDDMMSSGCSTSLVLSATLAGRYPHEFDRTDYTARESFDSSLISDMAASGRRCYVISSDLFMRDYWCKIYDGPDCERIEIPEAEFTTMRLAQTVVNLIETAEEPLFIFSHPFPLHGCDPSLKETWRSGMERFVWDSDQALGHVLDHIDLDKTTLLVCADHGNSMGENHHLFSHAFYPYETQTAVPCMVTGAGTGRVSGQYSTTQLRDLLNGRDICPQDEILLDTLYAFQPHRITAVRFDDWKYIAHYHWSTALTGLQEELYDLRYDPGEHRNLLADKGQHPLRSDWNSDSMRDHLGGQYGYDEDLLIQQLRHGRRAIARCWSEGFLKQIEKTHPAIAPQLRALFVKSHDLGIIQSIGKLAGELAPGPHCYEKTTPGAPLPVIPVSLDAQPRHRRECAENFSSLDTRAVPLPMTPAPA